MADDKKKRIVRLIELIEGTNYMLAHIKTSKYAFASETAQYQRLKSRYQQELLEILRSELDIPVAIPA